MNPAVWHFLHKYSPAIFPVPLQALQRTFLKARGELGSEFTQNRIKELTDKPYFAALFWSIIFSPEVTLIVTGILSIFITSFNQHSIYPL